MLKFEQGKVKIEISYGMLVSLGVIGFGLWYLLRDESKQGNGMLGFFKGKQGGGQGTQAQKTGHKAHNRTKRPSPPPPVPRSVDIDGGNGNDSFGGQSQGSNQGRRW